MGASASCARRSASRSDADSARRGAVGNVRAVGAATHAAVLFTLRSPCRGDARCNAGGDRIGTGGKRRHGPRRRCRRTRQRARQRGLHSRGEHLRVGATLAVPDDAPDAHFYASCSGMRGGHGRTTLIGFRPLFFGSRMRTSYAPPAPAATK